MEENRIEKDSTWAVHNNMDYSVPEGNVIASTPEKWLDDFPNGFRYHWDFDNLREAINFQRNFNRKWGLPDPLEG